MEIREFLELHPGKWLALRTSYELAEEKIDNSKSELTIENLGTDHPEVVKLCQQHNIAPSDTLGGTKTSWDNSEVKPRETGSVILVWVPDQDNPQVGQLLRWGNQTTVLGRYSLGSDEALTLTVEGDTYSEERVWFATPNLRLRTSVFKQANGFSKTSFYSEIRRITS